MNNKPEWLSNAILYQIFPPSFCDSNKDGIGDIQGVISKLDYLKWLGINVIWLNPCFDSPFNDAGYDIRDYYKVAPRYGSNADLKKLIREAHKRGIKLCFDLVAGHTSIDHPWFQESCKAEKNKYTSWYIWTDTIARETPPPLRCVRGYSERDGCFAVNFHWSQPALNYGFANPDPDQPWQLPVDHPDVKAVRREMINVMRYWLDMGIDGYRVDMAFSLIKNDPKWKANIKLWQSVRQEIEKDYPDAALIAEWSSPSAAIKAGFHVDMLLPIHDNFYTKLFHNEKERDRFGGMFHTSGHSFFDKKGKGDMEEFLEPFLKHLKKTGRKGLLSIPSGNHDMFRVSLKRNQTELKLIFAFLMTMPAVPVIYYGDEIGLKQLKIEGSKEGAYHRTGVRAPMQWTKGKNAGFSKADAEKLYLPLDNRKRRPTVSKQKSNPRSLLNEVKKLIDLRKNSPAFNAEGEFTPLHYKNRVYPFVYLREKGKKRFLVVINPADEKKEASIKLKDSGKIEGKPLMGKGVEISAGSNSVKITAKPVSYSIYGI